MSSIEYINSVVLTASASNITFSNIPPHYQDIKIILVSRSSVSGGTDAVFTQVNGDSSTNYSTTLIYHSGSSALSTRASNSSRFDSLDTAGNSAAANVFGIQEFDFISYSNSSINKTVLVSTTAGGDQPRLAVGLYRSNNPISSVSFDPQLGDFMVGTTATLWGVR